ncbi:MAG: TIGR03016 family PEP-CTERM system-associated outer membrane protein [Burkholderiales bacterium]
MPTRLLHHACTPLRADWCAVSFLAVLLATGGGVLPNLAQAQGQASKAQGEGAGRGFVFTPRVSASIVATDNVNLSAIDKQSDVYLQISPGLRLQSNGGRIRGSLDYSPSYFAYSKASEKNSVAHSLNASFVAEAVEDWAFVDVNANASQQSISALATQTSVPALGGGNQTQVLTYSISPYIKGKLRGNTNYEFRLRAGESRTESSTVSDSRSELALLNLSGLTGVSSLGWAGSLQHQVDDFSAGRRTTADRFRGTLSYALTPQLSLSAFAGYESSDQVGTSRLEGETHGFGFNWQPTDRTKFKGEREQRLFGNAYSLSFEHRMPRSVIRYSAGRDLTSGLNNSTGTVVSAYDLYFAQFASIEPDPVRRQALVNSFLLANGISPSTTVGGGFLTSALTLQRRQDLSLGLLGVRSTVTFLVTRTDSRRLDAANPASGDLGAFGGVDQKAFSVNWSHRLTPISTLSLLLSDQRNAGNNAAASNKLRLVSLNWSSRLGPQSTVSLGARHAVFDSPTGPYDESAITGLFSFQF